jgi:hypothetical protein
MNTKHLSKELLKLIDRNIDKVCIPVKNGSGIRMKHFIIRENGYSHLIYDLRYNKQVATTFTKTAALATAKALVDDREDDIDKITLLDREIQSKYNKCVQYKNTIANSDNPISIDNANIRYDISWDDVLNLRDRLDEYVFDK